MEGKRKRKVARQKLAGQGTKITLTPEGKVGGIRYKGNWKLLGGSHGAGGAYCAVASNLPEVSVPFEGVFRRAA